MSYVVLFSLVFIFHLSFFFFFFNDTATTEIYTLSLHDALPICRARRPVEHACILALDGFSEGRRAQHGMGCALRWRRSEEHTSELQSRRDLVCRLLLEKKKKKRKIEKK